MADHFVRVTGSDGNGGHAANDAWLTIGYAMNNVSAGDTIYVGAGTYRVSSAIAPASMGSMTYLYGDTDGSKTGDAGEVVVTNHPTDTSTAAAVDVFLLASKNYWTIRRLSIFCGNSGYSAFATTGTSANVTLQDCTLWSTGYGFTTNSAWGTTPNFIIERCRIQGGTNVPLLVACSTSASGADTNLNIMIRNCEIVGNAFAPIYCIQLGTATYKSGGVTVANCLLVGGAGIGSQAGIAIDQYVSSTYKLLAYNNLIVSGQIGMAAYATSQVTEDYNVIVAQTPRTNVTAGANSISNGTRNWRFSLGHEASFGGVTRPFGEFPAGSPLLGWGTSGGVTVTDDITGAPRPGSGAATVSKALGAYERSNSGTKETGTVRTGANALKIAGPGYHDFDLPVSVASTTVTIYVRWDATYAGTKPSMSVRNGEECGVTAATATATGSPGSWEQLSLNFTPTSVGIVTIRLTSSDTNGGGAAFWDDFAVA